VPFFQHFATWPNVPRPRNSKTSYCGHEKSRVTLVSLPKCVRRASYLSVERRIQDFVLHEVVVAVGAGAGRPVVVDGAEFAVRRHGEDGGRLREQSEDSKRDREEPDPVFVFPYLIASAGFPPGRDGLSRLECGPEVNRGSMNRGSQLCLCRGLARSAHFRGPVPNFLAGPGAVSPVPIEPLRRSC